MTDFPSYAYGTVSVDADGTVVTGTDTLWSGVNARAGDDITIAGHTVIIVDVTDETHLVIDAWPYDAVTAGAYKITQRSPLRFVGGQARADLTQLLATLKAKGLMWYLPDGLTEPDDAKPPLTADEGQVINDPASGKTWVMQSGAWAFIGVQKALGVAVPWSSATAYNVNDVVSLNGTSYVAIAPNTNQTPPNATYWVVLAAKGETGALPLEPVAPWATGTYYVVGPPASFVSESGSSYQCLENHTSGTFSTDLAAGKWGLVATSGGDMIAATYDPDNVGSNVFDSSNQSFLQSGTGAVARAVRDKLCETISVKDFGAIGDGSTDDTTAIQACVDYAGTLGSYGVCVYFPAGTYKITSAVTLPQIALCIRGHSMHSTWVVQATAGANAFEFTAVTSNQAAGLWPAWKAFQFLDISIGRSANTGGYGLSLSWVAMTSAIAPLLLVDNVQITGYGTAGNNWARCINLFNASSVIIQNSWLYGNISESPSTSEQPYTTEACIYFDSDDTAGQLNNTIRNVQTSGSQYGIFVNNWHEGFYISDSKFLQHWYGIRIAGNATHQNPSFFLVNSEFDVRVTAIYAENVYDMKINQCSFLKAGYGSTAGAGFSGVLVNLSKCPLFTAIGNTHHTSDTSLPTGINLAADCHKSVISACIFNGNAFGVSAEGTAAVIADNVFSDCTTAISATGSNNTIGKNVYDSCTIRITNTDSTNEVAPFRQDALKTAVFASSATSQTITFSLPAGRFVQAPRVAYITPAFDSGLYINAIYDQASSSATSAVVKIVEYQGAAIAAGTYVFCATFLDFN